MTSDKISFRFEYSYHAAVIKGYILVQKLHLSGMHSIEIL